MRCSGYFIIELSTVAKYNNTYLRFIGNIRIRGDVFVQLYKESSFAIKNCKRK